MKVLQVYRAEVLYFKVEDPDAYSVSNFPVFLNIHSPPVSKVPSVYGTPILEYPGLLKVMVRFAIHISEISSICILAADTTDIGQLLLYLYSNIFF